MLRKATMFEAFSTASCLQGPEAVTEVNNIGKREAGVVLCNRGPFLLATMEMMKTRMPDSYSHPAPLNHAKLSLESEVPAPSQRH